MKEFWIEINDSLPENTKENLLLKSKNVCSVALVGRDTIKIAKLQGFKTASEFNGEIDIIKDDVDLKNIIKTKKEGKLACLRVQVKNREDEEKILEATSYGVDYIIATLPDWKIIPLENLIARIKGKTKLLAEVSNVEEAKLALEILELGVDGILLKTNQPEHIMRIASILGGEKPKLKISYGKILRIKQLGLGDRVCVDTVELMNLNEGILVGCQSSGLFLVQAEVMENPHVEPRPFRVNAGPVSQYILASENRTRYLSELRAGDEVLITDKEGNVRITSIGRVKIEKRPLMLIEAKFNNNLIKTILQNAETIHLIAKNGPVSVSNIKPGDEVAVYLQPGGRHFGILVEQETVIER